MNELKIDAYIRDTMKYKTAVTQSDNGKLLVGYNSDISIGRPIPEKIINILHQIDMSNLNMTTQYFTRVNNLKHLSSSMQDLIAVLIFKYGYETINGNVNFILHLQLEDYKKAAKFLYESGIEKELCDRVSSGKGL